MVIGRLIGSLTGKNKQGSLTPPAHFARYGRYITEEETPELSLDEVIEQGIADLKERLNHEGRLTATQVNAKVKADLAASPSGETIQLIHRTDFMTKDGLANYAHADKVLREKGIAFHNSRDTHLHLAGLLCASGVMYASPYTSAKNGKMASSIFPPAAGSGSIGFNSTRPANTVRTLPAKLEPLFYTYIAYHEEGHALDQNMYGDEKQSHVLTESFKGELAEALEAAEDFNKRELNKRESSEVIHSMMSSICETRQDMYGLLKCVDMVKENPELGYTADDMLALCDYLHDTRITGSAANIQNYAVHVGVAAVRKQIEVHGLDASDKVREAYGNPSNPAEHTLFQERGNALHCGVRRWVYNRSLYLDGKTHMALTYQLATGEDMSHLLHTDAQEKRLAATLTERENAMERLKRTPSAHLTLDDAKSMNAILARAETGAHFGAELLGMEVHIQRGISTQEDFAKEKGLKKPTVYHQNLESRVDYLMAAFAAESDRAIQLPSQTEDNTPPQALAYLTKLRERESHESEHVLMMLMPTEEDGKYRIRAANLPGGLNGLPMVLEEAHQNNVMVMGADDAPAVKTMIAAAEFYDLLEDEHNLFERTKLDIGIEDDHAREAYRHLHDTFTGKTHRLTAVDHVIEYEEQSLSQEQAQMEEELSR